MANSYLKTVPGSQQSVDGLLFGQDYDNSITAPVTLIANDDNTYSVKVQTTDNSSYVELQSATAPSDNNENQIGTDIDVSQYNNMTIGVDYVNGDETKVTFTIYRLLTSSGTPRQTGTWSSGAGAVFTAESFDSSSDANQNFEIELDVSGCAYIQVKAQMADGSPTGTIAVEYYLSNNG